MDARLSLRSGERLLDALLEEGVCVSHDCGGVLACASCCVVVNEGEDVLSPASEDEIDMLDRAGALAPGARLACQALATGGEVVVLLPELNKPAKVAGALPISVTERAARHLRAQLARHPGAVAVRLAVEPSGCSGFGYRVAPIEALRPDDVVFDGGGVQLAVDPLSLPYVGGTTVDLVREGLAQRLRFENPNARQSCGCGESFGV
jgi:iron-sulfur cluster assembly protein